MQVPHWRIVLLSKLFSCVSGTTHSCTCRPGQIQRSAAPACLLRLTTTLTTDEIHYYLEQVTAMAIRPLPSLAAITSSQLFCLYSLLYTVYHQISIFNSSLWLCNKQVHCRTELHHEHNLWGMLHEGNLLTMYPDLGFEMLWSFVWDLSTALDSLCACRDVGAALSDAEEHGTTTMEQSCRIVGPEHGTRDITSCVAHHASWIPLYYTLLPITVNKDPLTCNISTSIS